MLLAGAVVLLALVVGGPSSATRSRVAALVAAPSRVVQEGDLSRAAVVALVREAETDDAALDRLRSVRSIDGEPADLQAVTADLGSARATRLGALADSLGRDAGLSIDPSGPREQARTVLAADKYQQAEVPKPFKGVLEWLADRLRPVGRFLDRIFSPILDLPGGPVILAVLLVVAVAAASAWLASRRSGAMLRGQRVGSALVDPAADPAELELRAEQSEVDGDLAGAVRLRYQGGLLRLVQAGRVALRPDTTAAEVAVSVGEPTLDELTSDFEEIVYGDREATPVDVGRSRLGWSTLVGTGTRR